jgi:hypothetical protein
MSTGDRRDGIEVAKINLQSTRITFNNHGVVQELRLAIAPVGGGPGVSDSSVDPAQPPVTADASGTHRPIQRHSGPILEGIVDSDQDPSADAGSVQPTILPPDQMANLVGTQPLNNQEKGDPNAQLALPAPSASPPSQLPEPAYQSAPATRPMSPGEPPTGGAAEWLAAGGDVPPPPPRNDF